MPLLRRCPENRLIRMRARDSRTKPAAFIHPGTPNANVMVLAVAVVVADSGGRFAIEQRPRAGGKLARWRLHRGPSATKELPAARDAR